MQPWRAEFSPRLHPPELGHGAFHDPLDHVLLGEEPYYKQPAVTSSFTTRHIIQ